MGNQLRRKSSRGAVTSKRMSCVARIYPLSDGAAFIDPAFESGSRKLHTCQSARHSRRATWDTSWFERQQWREHARICSKSALWVSDSKVRRTSRRYAGGLQAFAPRIGLRRYGRRTRHSTQNTWKNGCFGSKCARRCSVRIFCESGRKHAALNAPATYLLVLSTSLW